MRLWTQYYRGGYPLGMLTIGIITLGLCIGVFPQVSDLVYFFLKCWTFGDNLTGEGLFKVTYPKSSRDVLMFSCTVFVDGYASYAHIVFYKPYTTL